MALADNLRDSAREELRALRDQVNELMEERVNPALQDGYKRAGAATRQARAYTEDQAEAVAGHVRDQPLIAISVAAIVGFLFGRLSK